LQMIEELTEVGTERDNLAKVLARYDSAFVES
jgi:hypothetical protein